MPRSTTTATPLDDSAARAVDDAAAASAAVQSCPHVVTFAGVDPMRRGTVAEMIALGDRHRQAAAAARSRETPDGPGLAWPHAQAAASAAFAVQACAAAGLLSATEAPAAVVRAADTWAGQAIARATERAQIADAEAARRAA